MERDITDAELTLRKRARRRLVGAVLLVLITTVLYAVFFEPDPHPVDPQIELRIASPPPIPPPGAMGAVPPSPPAAVPAAGAPPVPAPIVGATPSPAPGTAVAQGSPATPQPRAVLPAKPVVGVTPVRQGKFALQLGAFSTQVNANRLQASLRKADITSYVETIKTPQGERFRLRAGPYHDRPAAERVRERLRGLGYDSSVVSL